MSRTGEIHRHTKETDIRVSLELDGSGSAEIETPIGFFSHMLELFVRHSGFDLSLKAKGDIEVDGHHLVEDTGIVLGQAFNKALGDKKGIKRYGFFLLPMDEALARVTIDISGRPFISWDVPDSKHCVGELNFELIREFWTGFINHAQITYHVDIIRGTNLHHIAEALFKASARAIRKAVSIDKRFPGQIPSTKGQI